MAAKITARTLKGFRDHLPADMIPRRQMLQTIEQAFAEHGFMPLDTPALEYAEILTGKYGDEGDKLLYRFADHGGRQVALRYDLTVPLARLVAQHGGRLPMPLRRYHVGSVWRADKPQRGRFREFMQCDVDIAGSATAMADAEILIAGLGVLRALGVQGFALHLNHRELLRALLQAAGLADEAQQAHALRAIDKWDKVGAEGVRAELGRIDGLDERGVQALMGSFSLTDPAEADMDGAGPAVASQRLLGQLRSSLGDLPALDRLAEVLALLDGAGLADLVVLDPTIARGLDYYTGVIFETRLTDPRVASMGAVMSGGRYDGLIGMFGKQPVPAVGISLGLDRLLAALRELDLVAAEQAVATVYVTLFDAQSAPTSVAVAGQLRTAGISAEIDLQGGKLGKQFKRGHKRGSRYVVVVGPDDIARGVAVIKDLRAGEQFEAPLDGGAAAISDRTEAPAL